MGSCEEELSIIISDSASLRGGGRQDRPVVQLSRAEPGGEAASWAVLVTKMGTDVAGGTGRPPAPPKSIGDPGQGLASFLSACQAITGFQRYRTFHFI